MNSTRFSVNMCVYHGDSSMAFDKAIDSVVNQTRRPSELVLVVDGPIGDELEGVLNKWACLGPDFFRVVRLKKNQGQGNARRIALANTRYEIVAIMDADDICVANRFELQIKYMDKHPEISVLGGNIVEFDAMTGKELSRRIVPENDNDIKKYLKKRNPINNVTVMVRKKDILAAGGFQDYYLMEDYYLWARMCVHGMKFHNLQEILVNVRGGRDMFNRRGGWKLFCSEYSLQKFLLKNKLISNDIFVLNIVVRFVVEVLCPSKLRGLLYKKFARS